MQVQEDISLAINHNKLGDFSMNLLDVSEQISDIFSFVDSKMTDLEMYYSGPEYQKLMDSYRIFRKNYGVVRRGVVAYSDDLIALINKVKAGDRKIAFIIEDITGGIRKKAKEINIK